MRGRTVVCHRCRHYFVTWDPAFPHGCRAMSFRSRRLPNEEVRAAMAGGDCLMFADKAGGTGRPAGDTSQRIPKGRNGGVIGR
jgi:hypothetical protein